MQTKAAAGNPVGGLFYCAGACSVFSRNLDSDLVRMARAGNRDAYGELIRRYQNQICGLACTLLDDRFEAEDVTQEAFLRAWLNLDLLSDPAKFAPWLRRIVFGVAIDWLRVFRPNLYRLSDGKTELEQIAQPARTESAWARLESIELQQRIGMRLHGCLPSTACRSRCFISTV